MNDQSVIKIVGLKIMLQLSDYIIAQIWNSSVIPCWIEKVAKQSTTCRYLIYIYLYNLIYFYAFYTYIIDYVWHHGDMAKRDNTWEQLTVVSS